MENRKTLSIGYHHNGLLGMSAVGLLILVADFVLWGIETHDYVAPSLIVGLLMVLQLMLDVRHVEEEYRFLTTAPYRPTNSRQLLRRLKRKWPTLLSIPLLFIFRAHKVGALVLLFMILFYPYRRQLYLRSQEEFKS